MLIVAVLTIDQLRDAAAAPVRDHNSAGLTWILGAGFTVGTVRVGELARARRTGVHVLDWLRAHNRVDVGLGSRMQDVVIRSARPADMPAMAAAYE